MTSKWPSHRAIPDLLRSLAALGVLLGLILGAPAALYVLAGSPLPRRLPRVTEVAATLTRPDDGTLLLGALTLIAWAAWASFTMAVVVDVVARLRGFPFVPRLPGLGAPQRVAAGLVASVVLASGSSSMASAAPPPPVSASAPPHLLTGQPDKPTGLRSNTLIKGDRGTPPRSNYRVRRGDTLANIARRELGDSRRWPQIWRLNGYRRQADGAVFASPNLIRPGWRLRLPGTGVRPRPQADRRHTSPKPAKPSTGSNEPGSSTSGPEAPRTPTEVPSASTASPAPSASNPPGSARSAVPVVSDQETAQAVIVINLPSGTSVALSFAAGVSAALAATRLRRRRRRVPPTAAEGVTLSPAPPSEPAVAALRRAHLRHEFTEHDRPPPLDADLVRESFSIDVPTRLTLGVRRGGTPVDVDLAGLNLGLAGPGSHDTARALLLDLLTRANHHRAEIIIASEDAKTLFGDVARQIESLAHDVPGLRFMTSVEAATAWLEDQRLTRARMLEDSDVDDVSQLLENDPGEVLPVLLLLTGQINQRLTTLLGDTSRYGMGAVILGRTPAGTTCQIDLDGDVTSATGELADSLLGVQLFQVAEDDAPQMLRVMATSHDVLPEEPREDDAVADPAPISRPRRPPAGGHRPRVRLLILGASNVEVDGRPILLNRREKVLELLIYLALHPSGATREEICACLWPDEDPGERFHSTLRHLRDPLRDASGSRALFVRAEGDRYRIDHDSISVDLWDFQQALTTARQAEDAPQRIAALERGVELIRGHLAEGAAYDWIDEDRYPFTRAYCDALAQLAELAEPTDPERALSVLEQARGLDPDNEGNYRRIIELQLRLDRPDAARRTARLLRARLDALDLEPEPETNRLLASLYGQRRISASGVGSAD